MMFCSKRVQFYINKLSALNSDLCFSWWKYKQLQKTLEMAPKKRKIAEVSDEKVSSSSKKPNVSDKEDAEDDADVEHVVKVTSQLESMKKYLVTSKESVKPASIEKDVSSVTGGVSAASKASWIQKGSLLVFTSEGVCASPKVACFDIDNTIISTQSGKVFPINTNDWKILLPEVPGKLKQLAADGFKIVFITNQGGIEKKKVNVDDFKKKIENIASKLNTPIQVYIATAGGMYRKPGIGMWNYLVEEGNCGVPISKTDSFYVGDAAGRPVNWASGKKKDFSCSDRLFAMNVGINFFTPEEFFQKAAKAKFNLPLFNPAAVITSTEPLLVPTTTQLPLGSQEVIVLVGSPASGKTHFVKNVLLPKGYFHVNRDTLKTWQKCVQATKEALGKGLSVVVDNTSPDVETRQKYVDVAKAAKVACRCFMMSTSLEHAQHNESFRELTDDKHEHVPGIAFNSFKSRYQQPTVGEGFQEIVTVNFVPAFKSDEEKNLYSQFLVEK